MNRSSVNAPAKAISVRDVDVAENRYEGRPSASSVDAPATRLSNTMRRVGMTLLSLLMAIALWQLFSTYWVNPRLVPPPTQVVRTAIPMFASGIIFEHVGISLVRIAVGFLTGTAFAVVLGVIMGRLRIVNQLLDPIIEVLRYLSPTAMIPIAVIWFGIGEMSKYFLIFWGTLFFVIVNTIAGVMRTPVARERAAQCLGATRFQIFTLVVIPSAFPYIVTGMRVAMASSFMAIIPAEMLAADRGLGFLLQTSGLLLQTNKIFVVLAIICALGFASDRLLRFIVTRAFGRYLAVPGGQSEGI